MNSVGQTRNNGRGLLFAALLAGLAGFALPAAADVYKQVRPDGSVIYTDTPVAGIKAQKMTQITEGLQNRPEKQAPVMATRPLQMGSSNGFQLPQLPPLPGQSMSAAPAVAPPPPPPPAPRPDPVADDRSRAVAQAETALASALQAQAAGAEPIDGERTGTRNGGSRLNQDYEKRQKVLADAVAAAREALKSAQGR